MSSADQAAMKQGESAVFVTLISTISALAGLLFGYDTGVISGAILFIQHDFALSTIQVEIVVSAVLLGAGLGAGFGGRLADRFGRRNVLVGVGLLFILGAIWTALAHGMIWLATGRVVVGVAIGIASFTAPLYISEVSPPDARGRLVSLNQLMITIGIVVSYLADYGLAGIGGWRWMFALAAFPALILVVGLIFVPESPRWLLSDGRFDGARNVLQRVRAGRDVETELKEIEQSLERQKKSWREVFSPAVRPALVVGIGLAIFQQFTGINTVIYYAPMIFRFAGFQSNAGAILATAGVGAVNVIFTVVALWLLDRVGRRPVLLWGLVGMILSLGVLGVAFLVPQSGGALAWIAVISLMIYVACFAVGLGPVFWLMIAEIYPLKVRGRAMSVAAMANWGSNLLVALTFLTLIEVLGRPTTFWVYAGVGILGIAFTYWLVPETKGRTLEEIEAYWRSRSHHAA
jgi:MFS transporter, SP family, galactose:H+ symporter